MLCTLVNNAASEAVQTTAPGQALIFGKGADVGKLKGPILHDLSTRTSDFHTDSAAELKAVIAFYDTRFNVGFTKHEERDLTAFLRALSRDLQQHKSA